MDIKRNQSIYQIWCIFVLKKNSESKTNQETTFKYYQSINQTMSVTQFCNNILPQRAFSFCTHATAAATPKHNTTKDANYR